MDSKLSIRSERIVIILLKCGKSNNLIPLHKCFDCNFAPRIKTGLCLEASAQLEQVRMWF